MVKEQNDKDHSVILIEVKEIKASLMDFVKVMDETKQDKDEFVFWRNTLVGGILVSIFLMVIGIFVR